MDAQHPPYKNEPFRRRPETNQFLELFRRLPEGGTLTYADIEKETGFNPLDLKYVHLLRSAAAIAGKSDPDIGEPPVHLQCLPGVGYKRLADGRAIKNANELHKTRFRNDTKKYRQKTEAVDPAKMKDADDRQAYGIAVQMVHLRETIGSRKTEKLIKQKALQNEQVVGMTKDETKELLDAIARSGFKG